MGVLQVFFKVISSLLNGYLLLVISCLCKYINICLWGNALCQLKYSSFKEKIYCENLTIEKINPLSIVKIVQASFVFVYKNKLKWIKSICRSKGFSRRSKQILTGVWSLIPTLRHQSDYLLNWINKLALQTRAAQKFIQIHLSKKGRKVTPPYK